MKTICGIDEAGRGPFAGPMTAAAVILSQDFDTAILKDSKQLSAKQRERLFPLIASQSCYYISWIWPKQIDAINIHNAALLGMKLAYEGLGQKVEKVFVDGKFVPDLDASVEAIIKGDSLVPEIMAASILAKLARDRFMIRYSWIEEEYSFDKHKGYPTKAHRERYFLYGPSQIHRYSYKIKNPSV